MKSKSAGGCSFETAPQKYVDEHDVTCAICLEILHRPRVLPCTHVFCLACLQNYINTSRVQFTCPSCRGKVVLPEKGVMGLPQDADLVEVVKDIRQKLSEKVVCNLCYKDTDIVMCSHCDTGWCRECGVSHKKNVMKDIKDLQTHLEKVKNTINCQDSDEMREMKNEWESHFADLIETTDEISGQDSSHEEVSDIFSRLLELSKSPLLPKGSKKLWKKDIPIQRDLPEEEIPVVPVDSNHARIYRKKSSLAKHKWTNQLVCRLSGVACCPTTSHIYITGSDGCRILVLNREGRLVRSWGNRGHGEGQFLCPTGIAFSQVAQEVFITDKWRHCINAFDFSGNFLRQVGRKGKGFGHFTSPEGIATDKNGRIYVADTCNHRVQILDNDGIFLRELGVVSSITLHDGFRYTKNELNEPTGVAVTPDGSKVYVADAGNNRIKVYDGNTGQRSMVIGSKGLNKGQFDSPECVAVDPGGYILVGDSGNGRVQVLCPDGSFFRYFGTRSNSHGEFGWVSGITLSKNNIIVTDFKNSVVGVY